MHISSKLAEPALPSAKEAALAEKSQKILLASMKGKGEPTFRIIKKGKEGESILLPTSALKLLVVILSQMAEGNAVTLIPIHAELTTQEAADLLNVSRPFLINLLKDGQIPYRKVGTRRRVLARDILHYKSKIDKQRLKTLEKLAEQDQELGLGY